MVLAVIAAVVAAVVPGLAVVTTAVVVPGLADVVGIRSAFVRQAGRWVAAVWVVVALES